MEDLSFGSRLSLALSLPFRVLLSGSLAARLLELSSSPDLPESKALPEAEPEEAPTPAPSEVAEGMSATEAEPDLTPALQLLSILQREGRFIDFIQEDMSGFADDEIGAAARVVQEGCKRGLSQYVELAPIRNEIDGATVTLEPGYDAHATRVTGKVAGQPPYVGTLAHHGWRAASVRLPALSAEHDVRVLAPAEVEI